MKRQLRIAATIVFLCPLSLFAQQSEEIWTVPTSTELGEVNRELRAKSPTRYLDARGDFNGDGQEDRAAIKVQRSRGEAAVMLYLSGRAQDPIVLRRFSSADIDNVGIETIRPGTYQPACARRGGVDCAPENRVTIPVEGVSIFTFESSATYYWLEGDQVRSFSASV